ncbi:MAG: hypothetical protein DMF85_13495 [Acidobacteria bacterium]|nr:MAG: hypothetical protein DMF85_13495 [Acidobacteriota bacterium]
MPREAKLFESAKGSPTRALSKLQGNIPPKWISRARGSRKNLEPDLVKGMKKVRGLRKRRPNARATIKAAERELRLLLNAWELAYRKESFYNGLRALLEISRDGETRR